MWARKKAEKIGAGTGLSATILFVNLMTEPSYRRWRWKNRDFRYRFFLRSLLVWPRTTFRYLQGLCELDELERLLEASPVLPVKPHRPYLYRGASVHMRARAVLGHYWFVQQLPDVLRQTLQTYRETLLISSEGKDGERLDITCGPCGFDREGELMLALYFKGVAVTRISFSFIRWRGTNTLFIGGLQGPRGTGPDIIRQATRICYGLFPRRVLCEAVAVLAKACWLDTIMAVSEDNHVLRHSRYVLRKQGRFVARYSECWMSVGGMDAGDGFYCLPVPLPRKAVEDIPIRKRAEYRRRYALLDSISAGIQARLNVSG